MSVGPRIVPVLAGTMVVLCMLAAPGRLSAQVSTRITSIVPMDALAGQPIFLNATLARSEGIDHAYLVYRSFSESEYRRIEMDVRGTSARAVIPAASVVPPSVEYYVVFAGTTGNLETYPFSETSNPFTQPPQNTLRISVHAAEDLGVLFLSPDPDLPVLPDDVVISFSLLRADSSVNRKATRLSLDGIDITAQTIFSGDIGVLSPGNIGIPLSPGQHSATVTVLNRSGKVMGTTTLSFTVSGLRFQAMGAPSEITTTASVALESRHEQVDTSGTWYNRGAFAGSLKYHDWRLTGNMFLTSDEKSDAQPQNRFFIGVESPWVQAGYGDQTPSFPDLILSGKRIRGVHAAVTLGFFNIAVSSGQTTRAVEGQLVKTIPDSLLAADQRTDSTASYLRIQPGIWGKYEFGTYQRDLIIVRPSFGSGENWQLGFTWMKSKDDVGSITNGSRPQENVVVGMDVLTRIDDRRVEFRAQGAFSAFNSDISTGNISDDRIRDLFPRDTSTIKDVRDILSRFITVNENLRPLSLKRISTGAGEASVQLRYFDNVFKFTYLYRGSDYNSFGQSFLRTDVQGFNLNDRYRLLDNELLLTAGFERLTDNTSKTKPATTAYATVNAAATYYPRRDFPIVTVGYTRFDNSNDLDPGGPDSLNSISNVTNRIFLHSSYEFRWGATHTASLNISTSDRSDATARALNVNALTVGLSLATRFSAPLTTSFDIAVNRNKLPSTISGEQTRLDYTSLGFQGRYEIVPASVVAQASVNPSFGDFRRTSLNLQTEWEFLSGMRLVGEFSFYKNDGVPDENFFSIRYRYDL